MVRKLKTTEHTDDARLEEAVRGSAHQIWQAGLGAFVKAQQEGSEAFARLVKEGAEVQKRSHQLAEERLSGLAETMGKMADNIGKQAAGSWEKLEAAFEERVSHSLRSLGVPTHGDIQALTDQVKELNQSVNMLLSRQKTAAKTETKPTAKTAKKHNGHATTKAAATKKTARSAAGRA